MPGVVTNDNKFLFTSESVGEGHPDKMCDQISDAVLDAHLAQDPDAKVACEVITKTGMVLLVGEITSKAIVDINKVVKEKVCQIGYDHSSKGFDYRTMSIITALDNQSEDIARGIQAPAIAAAAPANGRAAAGVTPKPADFHIGAGDQGLMFGYATDETEDCMPLTAVLAHGLNKKLAELRRNGTFPWAWPDTKTQVTAEYQTEFGGSVTPLRVHTVVVSTQHSPDIDLPTLRAAVMSKVIREVIPAEYLTPETVYHINPCGRFVIGGPAGDAGLTGRKIIVDTYGGWGAHGGGAFSGKDPTKVDRSGAYAARWVAKSLVKAKLVRRCLVQISYAIGVAEPIAISIEDYGTAKVTTTELLKIVRENFDLRPGRLICDLELKTPIYQRTAVYGHFGRDGFTWEHPKTIDFEK